MPNRNKEFPDSEFLPPERQDIRGVVYREDVRTDREEHRAWLLGGIAIWGKWALGLPVAAVAFWTALTQIGKWFQ